MKSAIKLLLLIFTVSCTNDKYYKVDEVRTFSVGANVADVLEPINVDVGLIGVKDIAAIDSLLIALTYDKNGLISIINTNTDSLLLTICTEGRGPNEYMSPVLSKHFAINESGDIILNIRDNLIRNRPLNITQSILSGRAICEEDITEDLDKQTTFYIDKTSRFTKTKLRPTLNFEILTPEYTYIKDQKRVEFKIYPELIANASEPLTAAYPYLGDFIMITPDATKVVDFSYFLDNFTLFNLTEAKTFSVQEGESRKLSDFRNLSRDAMMPIVKANYIDAHLTDEYIIALYDGRSYYNIENSEGVYEPIIRIFNMRGDYIKEYKVEDSLLRICYCEKNGGYIYGLDSEDRLIKYKIVIP